MALVFAGDWQAGLRPDRRGRDRRVVGSARSPRGERHLLQHDRRLSERRGPQASGAVGGRGRALDAPPVGGRLPRHLPGPSRRAQDAPRLVARGRAGGAPGVRGARAFRPAGWGRLCQLRGRRDPAADGRPRRGGRGVRAGVRVRARRAARAGAAPAGPRRDRRGGAVDRARTRRDRGHRRSPRTGRRGPACSRPRSTSRWRPATWRPPGAAVAELESIAADFQRPLFEAGALTARGELLLGEDRPSEASPILGRSWRLWQETDLPYESARARLRYAEAMAAEGDQAAARRDLRAARAVFERLGARLDLARVDALLGEEGGIAGAATQRMTKTFMFTDIVTSTDLVGLIGDEAWGELLRWHDRELRSAFANHRGEEVNHTGDGFFVAFERAGRRDSSARSTSSGDWRGTAASTGSRRRSGSVSTRPRRPARSAITGAAACTSPPASAPPRRARRSSSRARR